MPIADAILAEIDHESRTTAKVLARVPAEKLEWRPHAKSMTLGHLAAHVASLHMSVAKMLQMTSWDVAAARPAQQIAAGPELEKILNQNMDALRAALKATDDASFKEPFSFMRNGQIMRTTPKIGMIRAMINHIYHHRGQLSVYLRLLDIPVPSIYGPSADEPF